MSSVLDGRYAPSPTGDLHLGNLRTALAAWLYARAAGARFTLRVDDIDPDRSRAHFVERQLHDLARIGIDWDGDPIIQTHRLRRYERALAQLVERELVYPCFCSRADVRAAASAPHAGAPELAYPGTCAQLAVRDSQRRLEAGERASLRVRTGGERAQVDDELFGCIHIALDDFVVRRKDGVPSYLLATTVDDHDLSIGTVVRGADLASSAPRQRWLAERLELDVPRFAHVPLVVGPEGRRLAKRDGATTLDELADAGVDAHDVRAILARSLGIADATRETDAHELAERFSPQRIPREPASFHAL